ncbi:MAG: NAD(P)/FAD-dependent oxidoreductase [Candidatus Acidiferrales bacterium]
MNPPSQQSSPSPSWGKPPWEIRFRPKASPLPRHVNVAVLGAGFTGLSTAAWLRNLDPTCSVALLEAGHIGAGASGRTGGMVLAESAAGDLPGLGDVLSGVRATLETLGVNCDLSLPGAWEIGRNGGRADSPIDWRDSGLLRVVAEVPGGTVHPGKLVAGLARAAELLGAAIYERTPFSNITFGNPIRIGTLRGSLLADHVLFATNAQELEAVNIANISEPKFTLAVKTAPLSPTQLREIGLVDRKPFYTVDLPYLWGRVTPDGGIIFGGGLLHPQSWRKLFSIDVRMGEARKLFALLVGRIHALHPVLRSVRTTHRWGGPILFTDGARPIFSYHPQNPRAIVLGGYSGHGVALSVYLGRWAAEAILKLRAIPAWSSLSG